MTFTRERGTGNSEQRTVAIIVALVLLSVSVFGQNNDTPSSSFLIPDSSLGTPPLHHLEAGVAVPVFVSYGQVTPAPGASLGYYCDSVFAPGVGLGVWSGVALPIFARGGLGQLLHLMTGPVVTVWKNEMFSVPVGGGLCINAGFSNGTGALCAGVGVNAAVEWRFSSRSYAYARVQGAYTFTGGGEFGITPGIGVGFALSKEQILGKLEEFRVNSETVNR